VTKQINGLVDLAIAESDHISRNFLQWFVNEQLEEVSSMEQLLSIVRRAGEGGSSSSRITWYARRPEGAVGGGRRGRVERHRPRHARDANVEGRPGRNRAALRASISSRIRGAQVGGLVGPSSCSP